MRIQFFPDMKGNPYQRLFAAALERHGVAMEPGRQIDDQVLTGQRDHVDAVHFHWIEGLIAATTGLAKLRRAVGLYRYCRCARRLGIRVVWTVHNHTSHEEGSWTNQVAHLGVARQADLIITHSQWSARWVTRWYKPRGRVVVMPHGNYDGCYRTNQTPEATRNEYRLDADRPVVGMIGAVREYRGQDTAIEAVQQLKGQVQLLIAGWAPDESYKEKIQRLADGSDDTTVRLEGLGEHNYANALEVCDAILLPYHRITGSGALMSAWTMGKPVIASDLPFFTEFIPQGSPAGRLFSRGRADRLAEAIERMLAVPHDQRRTASLAQAQRYSWDRVVEPVVRVIKQWG